MFYKSIIATLVAASFSVVAVAQPVTESDATSILDNYASSFNALSINVCLDSNRQALTGSALKEAFTVKQNEVVGLLNRGEGTMAAGKASTLLGAFGHCYSKSDNQIDRPTYANFMGGLIAVEASTYDNADKMKQAITLLDYAKSHSSENLQFLKLVEPYRKQEKTEDIASSGDATEVNFYELGELRKSNALRLRKKYDGKTVMGEAKVFKIGEYKDGRIFINLDGPKTLDSSGGLESAWMIVCKIKKGSSSEDKAIDLDKGDTFKIKGTMKVFQKSYFTPAVENCEIL